MEVAKDWKGNRREKKETSSWRGESYSEGRQSFAYPLSPLAYCWRREKHWQSHIFLKRLNFIIKSKKKYTAYMTVLLKGYECTKILIANFLMGLKGVRMYRAEVALNREIAFPLFSTIKVWKRKHNRWNRIYRTHQGHCKRVRDPSKIPHVVTVTNTWCCVFRHGKIFQTW